MVLSLHSEVFHAACRGKTNKQTNKKPQSISLNSGTGKLDWLNGWAGKPNKLSAATAKSLQSCPTLCDHRRQPTRLHRPWDSPGKNTGVGCHFLLQRMKVKSESEVAQSCPTLSDPMDCSLPGSSAHGIFQARVLEWGAIAFFSSYLGLDNNSNIIGQL